MGQRLTLPALLKLAAVFATLVTVTHSPSILLHGGEHALKDLVKDLKSFASDLAVTEAELKVIVSELSKAPDAQKVLDSVGATIKAVVPVLEDLTKAYQKLE